MVKRNSQGNRTAVLPDFVKEVIKDPSEQKVFADIVAETSMPMSGTPPMGERTVSGTSVYAGTTFGQYQIYPGMGYYNSADLPLNVLDMMRRDYQVALGMSIVKFPISQLSYTVNCKSPKIRAFIKQNLENKWSSIIRDCLKSLDF